MLACWPEGRKKRRVTNPITKSHCWSFTWPRWRVVFPPCRVCTCMWFRVLRNNYLPTVIAFLCCCWLPTTFGRGRRRCHFFSSDVSIIWINTFDQYPWVMNEKKKSWRWDEFHFYSESYLKRVFLILYRIFHAVGRAALVKVFRNKLVNEVINLIYELGDVHRWCFPLCISYLKRLEGENKSKCSTLFIRSIDLFFFQVGQSTPFFSI